MGDFWGSIGNVNEENTKLKKYCKKYYMKKKITKEEVEEVLLEGESNTESQ